MEVCGNHFYYIGFEVIWKVFWVDKKGSILSNRWIEALLTGWPNEVMGENFSAANLMLLDVIL